MDSLINFLFSFYVFLLGFFWAVLLHFIYDLLIHTFKHFFKR